jgi:uncharacterized protein YjiS (DUF1127 family)
MDIAAGRLADGFSSVLPEGRAPRRRWVAGKHRAAGGWIAAAIRLRRERDRSRQQLRELNDHLLKDIGLRREDLGFEAPKPPWHRD